jgi:hypothetical protein
MSSIIKVDQIQLANGSTPTAGDLGLNVTGGVLQVVSGSYSTSTTNNTTTYTDTGITATITPSSTSSKVLVLVTVASVWKDSSNNSVFIRLVRDSTVINKLGEGYIAYTSDTSTNGIGSVNTAELDSPNTTSAVTYKVQFRAEAATNQVGFSGSSTKSTITLLEIAG